MGRWKSIENSEQMGEGQYGAVEFQLGKEEHGELNTIYTGKYYQTTQGAII